MSGRVSATPIQKRLVMLTNSGFAESLVATRGSSAIPQMGQAPGLSRSTSGCIGQVYLPVVADGMATDGSPLASAPLTPQPPTRSLRLPGRPPMYLRSFTQRSSGHSMMPWCSRNCASYYSPHPAASSRSSAPSWCARSRTNAPLSPRTYRTKPARTTS